MKILNTFLFEYKHFIRNKAKLYAYLLFVLACVYALYYGFSLQKKQNKTLARIEQSKKEEISEILKWYDQNKKGPEDRPWIDITTPFWAIWNLPTYTLKKPSALLPLGIGQTEQYGYYKKVTNWSSVYDEDMVEELANPERLAIGNIDFSFMVIYLLPVLFIIFAYNIHGFEKDFNFDKQIAVQTGNKHIWILSRLIFYVAILSVTVLTLILSVSLINNTFAYNSTATISLILLSIMYIFVWATVFYLIISKSNSSSSIAFKMISTWLIFCVLIPSAVHQFASVQYPPNLMLDYLDANRKEAYEIFELPQDTLSTKIKTIYPEIKQTKHGLDAKADEDIISNTVSAIINQKNKVAIAKIEQQNQAKNIFIVSSYWYNPVSWLQNKWNNITESDYNAYKNYRNQVQQDIDKKIRLLVFECWDKKTVNKQTYQTYLELLK